MKKVFISAGHQSYNNIDPGAIANGVKEADLTTEFRNAVVSELRKLNVQVITDTEEEDLKGTMTQMSAELTEKDLAIDIHFNAATPAAYGTEVFIPDKYTPFEFTAATALLHTIITVLQTTSRGVKTESQSSHKRLGFMRPNCENILIEVCFITNTSDLFKYQHNKQTLALNLASTIQKLL